MNKTLEWLYRAERPTGGLAAWQHPNGTYHESYVECTGYTIPTLLKWDALDLALRCADWLLKVQNGDGSFNGLDGIPRPFDTSAVVEGLEAVYKATGTAIYRDAANRAKVWMRSQITEDGYLKNSTANFEPCVYNLRASAIIGNRRELEYWQGRPLIKDKERSHYLAYAIEGLLDFGKRDAVMPLIELAYHSGSLLQPFYVDYDWRPLYADFDLCASAQMALIFKRVGLDASRHYAALQKHVKDDGGLAQSTGANGGGDNRSLLWAARFWLELMYEMEKA